MKNLRVPVMLILIMAVMPVAVAFGHYSGIASQIITAQQRVFASNGAAADAADILAPQQGGHCQPDKPHPTSCSFHVCVDCAITSFFGFLPVYSPERYDALEKPASISLFPPPDFKPPIIVL